MKKALFIAVVLLTTTCALDAQNTDKTVAEKPKAEAKKEDITRAEYKSFLKSLDQVAQSDAPEEDRRTMIIKIIEEYNAKHPEIAFRLVEEGDGPGAPAKDRTKLLENKMVTQLVELSKDSYMYTLDSSDGSGEQPVSRGAANREFNCIQDYCSRNLPFSCIDRSSPYYGQFCIVANVGMYSVLVMEEGGAVHCTLIDQYALVAACTNGIEK